MAHRKISPQKKALIKVLLSFLVFGAALFFAVQWARTDAESELAGEIRRVIGFPAPADARSAPAPAPVAPEPEPAVAAVEPEPEPVPEPEVEVAPEPTPLTYGDWVRQSRMWPRTLQLTLDTRVPISFNGNSYGYLEFVSGQTITVDAFTEPDRVVGAVNGNYLSLPVRQTDFTDWFEQRYGAEHRLILDGMEMADGSLETTSDELSRSEFLAEMRYWCYRNFGMCRLEVEKDTLVLYWLPEESAPINYRFEARELARRYLTRQAAFGGRDNYAACEIRHPESDELLGSGSIFLLNLDAQMP